MLIGIRRQDNSHQETQMVEHEGIAAAPCADPTACYEDQKSVFRMLCGSI